MTVPMLQLENVVVDFDGFKAIDDLSLTIESGSMTVVIGPNGAGKSTMCDSIIGRVRPASGRVLFHGAEIQAESEHAIVGRGICRKFQTPGVLVALSVIDNLAIAATRDRNWWACFSRKGEAEARARAEEILEQIGLTDRRDTLAGNLSHGEKQWLEIGMVVATDAELLLLDEPTAGMGASESSQTATLVRSLLGKHAVLVIDHDIDFVSQLGGHVVVLHQGRLLREGTLEQIRADEEVAAIYLGRAK
ncbi:ABC transporter ATP-binding protein [Sphingobium sp. TA15]|uniref:Branched-chain amino acid transport system ATP-binding protein n=4 Tax=Sphingobium indicum TaxID=332055 RepID=D4YZJ9_SPHIU|nr:MULTISPECIES: urea ABC transporter ATP-binding protein UrtD [Sphingobium]EPR16195.1 urea ABC transporter ATP-binding protein [Sphingobium indicum IP26]KEY98048.1 urea ABC transporter ATP-binding protein [Sphingomonas sp. BHC-A]BDD65102.1 ABC transporter ATP-binding protein [Sphingobium sp. TA15]APL94689.1 urea ABC transporter ATP-binding protein UrtD [Sphingobium indicum B90A]EQB01848.1 urea ABC transporter ATP-binding protein [Sphingobium sp. HDIP04]